MTEQAERTAQAAQIRHRATYDQSPGRTADAHVALRVIVTNPSGLPIFNVSAIPDEPLAPPYGAGYFHPPVDVAAGPDVEILGVVHLKDGVDGAPEVPTVTLTFNDEAGRRWRRSASGDLTEVDQPAP